MVQDYLKVMLEPKKIKDKGYCNPCYNSDDLYRYYRELHSENINLMKVQAKLFKQIYQEYNRVVIEYILKGNKLRLPYTLGEIYIEKRKMNFSNPEYLPKDYGHYTRSGRTEKIYYLNEHSNGWKAKFKWNKKHCKVDNNKYYSFKIAKNIRKQMGKVMKAEGGYLLFNEAKRRRY